MNIYEINQTAYTNLPDMTAEQINYQFDKLKNYLESFNNYVMLLCKERSDYTVFKIDTMERSLDLFYEITDILESRGTFKGIETRDDGSIEFWMLTQDDNICHMYLLFDYDWGVIDVGAENNW